MKKTFGGLLALFILAGMFRITPVYAKTQSASFKEITSELSCNCGCGLLVSACAPEECAASAEIRGKVTKLLNDGKTEPEILQAMVGAYGTQILAAPPKEGFNISAYVLPFAFLIVGGYVLMLIVTRWLPKVRGASATGEPPNVSGNGNDVTIRHRKQIEQELKDLDL